jgi:hypothetical protein
VRFPQARSRAAGLPCRREHSERRAYDVGSFLPHVGRGSNTLERFACLALAEAKTAQRSKRLRVRFGRTGVHDRAIGSTVRVAEAETGGDSSLDSQLTSVLRPMVRGTKENESILVVVPSFRAKHDVMEVDERGVPTSRNHAPAAVAPHDLASNRRWYVLMSSPWRHRDAVAATFPFGSPHVGRRGRINVTQVLRIAAGHLHDFRSYFDLLAPPSLPPASTTLADREPW